MEGKSQVFVGLEESLPAGRNLGKEESSLGSGGISPLPGGMGQCWFQSLREREKQKKWCIGVGKTPQQNSQFGTADVVRDAKIKFSAQGSAKFFASCLGLMGVEGREQQ